MTDSLQSMLATLAASCIGRKLKIATAESCTGGMISAAITDIAGSSVWFDRGFVTYSNEAKQQMLGVAEQTLAAHGAVSAEVVAEMANGALSHSQADLSVSVSGVAGPGGGSAEKPVGTVYLAVASRGAGASARRLQLDGDRAEIRRATVLAAIQGLIERAESA
jgi:nicotinamide-nucleotide amidase